MDNRIALAGIIVENPDATVCLNDLLHEYSRYIVGRMGVPYRDRGISIISIILDAPNQVISSLTGKLGMLQGVQVKTIYAKVSEKGEEDHV